MAIVSSAAASSPPRAEAQGAAHCATAWPGGLPAPAWAILFLCTSLWLDAARTLGAGTDRDGLRVLRTAAGLLEGHYQASRSWGFPLHEAASAVLLAAGGPGLVGAGAALMAALAVLVLAVGVPPSRRTTLVAALCLTPVVFANASVPVDFCWDLAAGALAWRAAVLARPGRRLAEAGFAAACLALCLLRPDNVLFAAALCGAVGLGDWRRGLRLACILAGCAALASGVYVALSGGALVHGVSTTRPLWARVPRAAVLLAAALGPGGALAAGLALGAPGTLATRLMLVAWALYLPRFVLLPDQLEYLTLPVVFTLRAGILAASTRLAWGLAALAALPLVAAPTLFARDGEGRLHLHPAFAPGVVAQERAARTWLMRLDAPEAAARVAAALPEEVRPGLRHDEFLPAFVSAGGDLAIGRGQLYRVVSQGADAARVATVPRARYRRVFTCDGSFGPGIGWRGLEMPEAEWVPGDALACTEVP